MKTGKGNRNVVSNGKIAKGTRAVKENVIIEATVKQLDTQHLTALIKTLMKEQFSRMDAEQFERSYQAAVQIRKNDPELFNSNPSEGLSFELMWADRNNGVCSEPDKAVVFLDAAEEPVKLDTKSVAKGLFQGLRSAVTN